MMDKPLSISFYHGGNDMHSSHAPHMVAALLAVDKQSPVNHSSHHNNSNGKFVCFIVERERLRWVLPPRRVDRVVMRIS